MALFLPVLTLIKRIPAANKPKKDMDVCIDALFIAFKGHLIAFACQELGIGNIIFKP